MKILILGNGYLGSRCNNEWSQETQLCTEYIHNIQDAENILNKYSPDVVLNATGITGKPNVDWCETHQSETINGNTILPLIIAQACLEKKIYMLHLGTGCIFYGKSPDSKGWKEDDFANPLSVYSKSKYAADLMLSTLENVGIARIRLPSDYIPSDKNLITRLGKYKTILDVENSITIIEDLLRVLHGLLERRAPGIFHCTQSGSITYREFIDLYKKYIDPTAEKEWVTEEELVGRGLASKNRATNILQSVNLEKLGLGMRPIREMLAETMQKYAKELNP